MAARYFAHMDANPLLSRWDGPYGLPPFDAIKPEHFRPAFEAAMAVQLAELDAIAENPASPTFQNTIVALDRSGEAFSRLQLLFCNLAAAESDGSMQTAERELMPLIAAHQSRIGMHSGAFERVESLFRLRSELNLAPEELRLLERTRLEFVMKGCSLGAGGRERLALINQELAGLYTSFNQALRADEEAFTLRLDAEEDRAGLPGFLLDAAAELAAEKHLGAYALNLSPALIFPFLTFSPRRDLRETLWRAYYDRGRSHPDRDNRPVAEKILGLRAEWAALMGCESYAAYVFADRMAKTPQAAAELLLRVWEPARTLALREQRELEAIAADDGLEGPFMAWDWRYYAEKLRRERYDLDEGELKPLFSLERMVSAMFDAAGALYGLAFAEMKGVPLFHPDARLYELRRSANQELLGVFILDPYQRASKRGGVWMSEFRHRSDSRSDGPPYPIAICYMNLAKPSEGKPTLLSLDEVRSLFHEFGHCLHSLLSEVTYNKLAGANVLMDFVEFPSQLNERWALAPELLRRHARHAVTGEAIPESLIEGVQRAETFNQGYILSSYIASALIDLSIHGLAKPEELDLTRFEDEECRRLGLPEAVGLRCRLAHFSHLFACDDYAAAYYAYLWALVLAYDAFEAFELSGDLLNPLIAERFRRDILAVGNAVDPAAAYRSFRGRDPDIGALLRARGLA